MRRKSVNAETSVQFKSRRRTSSGCYLSSRIDSVFLSFSSHVSFSSAMIFSVSCHSETYTNRSEERLADAITASGWSTGSYQQSLGRFLLTDRLRLLAVLHLGVCRDVARRHGLSTWRAGDNDGTHVNNDVLLSHQTNKQNYRSGFSPHNLQTHSVTWRGGAILWCNPIGCECQLQREGGQTCNTEGAIVVVDFEREKESECQVSFLNKLLRLLCCLCKEQHVDICSHTPGCCCL